MVITDMGLDCNWAAGSTKSARRHALVGLELSNVPIWSLPVQSIRDRSYLVSFKFFVCLNAPSRRQSPFCYGEFSLVVV